MQTLTKEPIKKKTIIKKVVKVRKTTNADTINTCTDTDVDVNEATNVDANVDDTDTNVDTNVSTSNKVNTSTTKTLEELVREGKSVEEIAKILGKPEKTITFQMKMCRFNNFSNDKETNVAKLLDENAKKISQKVTLEIKEKDIIDKITKQPYDEDKLLKNIAKIYFLEKIKNDDKKLNELYDNLIFESTLEIKKSLK